MHAHTDIHAHRYTHKRSHGFNPKTEKKQRGNRGERDQRKTGERKGAEISSGDYRSSAAAAEREWGFAGDEAARGEGRIVRARSRETRRERSRREVCEGERD